MYFNLKKNLYNNAADLPFIDWLIMVLKILYAKGTFHRYAMEIHIHLELCDSWRNRSPDKTDKNLFAEKKYNETEWLPITCKFESKSTFPYLWCIECFTTLNQDWVSTQNSVLVGLSQEMSQTQGSLSEVSAPLSHRMSETTCISCSLKLRC